MKYEKILFHTRFRDFAFESLESVLALKNAGLKEIVFTHVIPTEDVGFVPYGGYLKEEAERLTETATTRFTEWQDAILSEGIRSKIRIEVGSVPDKIMTVAQEEKVQLIVVGRKKRSLSEMVYVGSHILDLLRRSPLPTLMAKYMVEFEADGERLTRINDHIFTRPMLASDWSDPSENALAATLGFKDLIEKALVTHVIGDQISNGADTERLKSLEAESLKRLERYSSILQKGGVSAESRLSFGKPAREILHLARDWGASMIILGRTGKDWFQEYWLGGVSHKVAEASELPVLLVP